MRPTRQSLLAILMALLGASGAGADVVVIASAKSGIEHLTRDDAINIFLGRYRTLSSGIAAAPVDQPASSSLRAEFYRKLVNKDIAEINAYWARLYFSGKTSPPVQAATPAEVLTHVLGTPGGIGYAERSQVDTRLKILLEFPP
jgi:ABC-type phosphate transport system substrate-binding protein